LAAEGCICHGCGIRYRGDLNIPDEVWAKISNGDNLLCASCIARRIIEAGIWTAIRGEDVDLNPNMPEPEQSAGRWDGKHWLEGTAGGCNIVTYNGEDVVGVGYIANDNAREQVIADHNARLDAQSADTPSEAPVAWAVRVEDGSVGVLGWQDIAKFEHFMTLAKLRDGCSVVYAYESTSRPQPARGEVSEAEIEAAMSEYYKDYAGHRDHKLFGSRPSMRAALEDAKRARTAGPKLAYYQTHEPPHCPTCDCAVPDEQGQK
jgi:hypothetical protein